jgi:predicted  nucleic acid-binding Zn-ribbon protein
MTTEERFDRIEHLAARMAEERRRDREEYKALRRDTERHINELAVDTRLRFEQVADQIAALTAESRETTQRLRELGEATDARIAALVSAIGEHVRQGHPQQ